LSAEGAGRGEVRGGTCAKSEGSLGSQHQEVVGREGLETNPPAVFLL
jgi:hypothetical protein